MGFSFLLIGGSFVLLFWKDRYLQILNGLDNLKKRVPIFFIVYLILTLFIYFVLLR
jgi:uncharacterized membrane protein